MRNVFIILVLLFSSVVAQADTGPSPSEETKIGKEHLIDDFISASISRSLWFDPALSPVMNYLNAYYSKNFSTPADKRFQEWVGWQDPLIAETILRTKGYPQPFVINKWVDKITIGIDWPRKQYVDSKGETRTLSRMAFSVGGEKEKFYDLFEQKIKSLIPEIEALTGLKVEFFSPDDPREMPTTKISIYQRQRSQHMIVS